MTLWGLSWDLQQRLVDIAKNQEINDQKELCFLEAERITSYLKLKATTC